MNVSRTSIGEILAHFVRAGVGSRDDHLPEGATLGGLERQVVLCTEIAPYSPGRCSISAGCCIW